MMPSF